MSQDEESQRLLGVVDQDQDSEEEETLFQAQPPPPPTAPTIPVVPSDPTLMYNDPNPATTAVGQSVDTTTGAMLHPVNTTVLPPPPEYSMHANPGMVPPKYTPIPGTAMPVNIQMDGRLVPATLMQDPSGNHMVYICEPQGPQDGTPTTASGRPVPPKDHLGLSIIALLCSFFFLPLAIMAFIKSMEVHRLYKMGDYTGAQLASKKANSWGSAAIVFGIFSVLLLIALRYFLTAGHRRYYYHY